MIASVFYSSTSEGPSAPDHQASIEAATPSSDSMKVTRRKSTLLPSSFHPHTHYPLFREFANCKTFILQTSSGFLILFFPSVYILPSFLLFIISRSFLPVIPVDCIESLISFCSRSFFISFSSLSVLSLTSVVVFPSRPPLTHPRSSLLTCCPTGKFVSGGQILCNLSPLS